MKSRYQGAPWSLSLFTLLLLMSFDPRKASAEDEEKAPAGWKGSAELTAVLTSGNAEAETFGLGATMVRKWQASTLTLDLAGLRAESTTTERFGIGTPDGFREVETSTTTLTAENYLLRARYDRLLSERFFWYLGGGWDRNTFAGIDNRYVGSAGAGHKWFDDEDASLATTYGLTYTRQENVVGGSDSFAGVRLGYEYGRLLTPTTRFGSILVTDTSLDQTSNYRVDLTNSVTVSMTDRLALKVSLQALYDNQPSLVALPLFDEAGAPTEETGLAPLDELDLLWTAAAVVKF